MNQTNPVPRPDRTFIVDTFEEQITDLAAESPAIVSPPPPPNCITATCDTVDFVDCEAIYPDGDTNRETRRGE